MSTNVVIVLIVSITVAFLQSGYTLVACVKAPAARCYISTEVWPSVFVRKNDCRGLNFSSRYWLGTTRERMAVMVALLEAEERSYEICTFSAVVCTNSSSIGFWLHCFQFLSPASFWSTYTTFEVKVCFLFTSLYKCNQQLSVLHCTVHSVHLYKTIVKHQFLYHWPRIIRKSNGSKLSGK